MQRKQVEGALKQVNRNLSLMNNITRHDILNQVTVILGYLHIIKEDITDQKQREYLEKVEKATEIIIKEIEFTREYQDIGSRSTQWQNLLDAIHRAIQPLDLGKVELHLDLENMEIYADPMLEKVFYNLADNSLRHGGRISEIRVSYHEVDDGIYLIWADNGIGVPVKDKKRIFQLGVGRNHGFGLFLIQGILAITNMKIRETGEPGKGARFEIHIPMGYFRRPKSMLEVRRGE
jgi:signal transduction histidine kinase